MYHTPSGDRVLLGAERRLFMQSLGMIVDLLATDDMEFGIDPFDQLQPNQKLVVLYNSARGLLRPNEPPPMLTAFIEAAVATVYEFAEDQLNQEIGDPELRRRTPYWRRLVLEAAREQVELDEMPDDTSCDKEEWDLLLECLAVRVLWDNDYQMDEGDEEDLYVVYSTGPNGHLDDCIILDGERLVRETAVDLVDTKVASATGAEGDKKEPPPLREDDICITVELTISEGPFRQLD